MSLDQAKSLIFWLALALLILLATAAEVGAVPLSNYRERVARAAGALEQLQRAYTEEDLSSRQQHVAATIAQVRADLPSKEMVGANDARMEVDNAWLHDALSVYEKTDWADQRSAEALLHITERLRALEARLIEVETGKPAATASKDDNKARLAEILRRPEFNQKPEESNALQRLWKRITNWLIELLNLFIRLLQRLFPGLKAIQPGSARMVSNIAQILVVAIALAVIGFVAWKLLPRYLRKRPKKKAKKREARIVLGERLEPDQTASDLFAEAETLARGGDLRAAIRKAYIALLCELGDRKLISLAQHKTNRDYLNAVRDKSHLYGSMRPLTVSFEIHWYGLVPAGESDWDAFRHGYQQALKVG